MTDAQLIQAMAAAIRDLFCVIAGVADDKVSALAQANALVKQAQERSDA